MARVRHRDGRAHAGTPRVSLPLSALHLVVLSSFALAWRYFDPLRETPQFFIVRGLGAGEIVSYAVTVLVLPPAILIGIEWIAGLASARARDGLHLLFVAGFFALIAWQAANDILKPAPSSATVIQLGSVGLAVAAGLAYRRSTGFRAWLTVLAPAPLVILILFLVFSPIRPMVFGGGGPALESIEGSGAPVVVVVLDELPVVSLLGPDRRIDAERYPHLERLAASSTWYRNTASTADYTSLAVPILLTGRRGDPDRIEIAADHPSSLFTLLGGSYHLDVSEEVTDLCQAACPEQVKAPLGIRLRRLYSDSIEAIPAIPSWIREPIAARLEPPATDAPQVATYSRSVRRLRHAPAETRFRDFLRILGRGPSASLYYLHVGLPHRPFHTLPDGHQYEPALNTDYYERWPPDGHFAREAYRRHLLQVGYTDRLMGSLTRRLKRVGLFDRALIVVTADHGASFRPGDQSRNATQANAAEVAKVPLIIKAPGQRRGRISDARVETQDVLPTIAKTLGVQMPWRVEGRPAGESRPRDRVVIQRVQAGGTVAIDWTALDRDTDAALGRKLRLFGWGRSRPGLFGGGPAPGLIGRRVSSLHLAPRSDIHTELTDEWRYQDVRLADRVLPAEVSGRVTGRGTPGRTIAVAVNGRVVATTWSAPDTGQFSTVVPPSSLQDGANHIEILTPVEAAQEGALAVLRATHD